MTTDFTNMTNEEYFHINGTLSVERIEELLDYERRLTEVADLVDTMREYVSSTESIEEIMEITTELSDRCQGQFKDECVDFVKDMGRITKNLNYDSNTILNKIVEIEELACL